MSAAYFFSTEGAYPASFKLEYVRLNSNSLEVWRITLLSVANPAVESYGGTFISYGGAAPPNGTNGSFYRNAANAVQEFQVPSGPSHMYFTDWNRTPAQGPIRLVVPVNGPPQDLVCSAMGRQNQIDVSWTPVEGASYYRLYRDGFTLATGSFTEYADQPLGDSVTHTYYVDAEGLSAQFASSQGSLRSNEATATTLPAVRRTGCVKVVVTGGDHLNQYAITVFDPKGAALAVADAVVNTPNGTTAEEGLGRWFYANHDAVRVLFRDKSFNQEWYDTDATHCRVVDNGKDTVTYTWDDAGGQGNNPDGDFNDLVMKIVYGCTKAAPVIDFPERGVVTTGQMHFLRPRPMQ